MNVEALAEILHFVAITISCVHLVFTQLFCYLKPVVPPSLAYNVHPPGGQIWYRHLFKKGPPGRAMGRQGEGHV